MAPTKKIVKQFELHIPAGAAQPSPPVGPMLGQNGVPIGPFVKDFNDKTREIAAKYPGAVVKVPAIITVYADKSYDLDIGTPLTSHLLLRKVGQKQGSETPNKTKVGKLTRKDLEELAEVKRPVMNTDNIDSIVKSLAGTAKSLGIEVTL